MSCDYVSLVHEIDAAYLALRERCAPEADGVPADTCLIPHLMGVWMLARGIAEGGSVEETVARPDIPQCFSEQFMRDMLAWIQGMTCGEQEDGYFYLHRLVFASDEGYSYDPGAGGLIGGWSATWELDGVTLPPEVNRPGTMGLSVILNGIFDAHKGARTAGLKVGALANIETDSAEWMNNWARMLDWDASKWMYVIERYRFPDFSGEMLARAIFVSNLTDWDQSNPNNPTVMEYRLLGNRVDSMGFENDSTWNFELPENVYESF